MDKIPECPCKYLNQLEGGQQINIFLRNAASGVTITFQRYDPIKQCIYGLDVNDHPILFNCRDVTAITPAYSPPSIGIVTEFSNNRFTIFDPNNLSIIQQVSQPSVDYIDVAISSDCRRAILSAFNSKRLILIDPLSVPVQIIDDESTPLYAEDVALTSNSRYGLIVDGGGGSPEGIASYSIENQTIEDYIPNLSLQAVAASPIGNGLILAVEYQNNKLHVLTINNEGKLTNTGIALDTNGLGPINVTFHPSGQYAFVANTTTNDIVIFNTQDPYNVQFVSLVLTSTPGPQSIVVSNDGKKVYDLTRNYVEVFDFTSSAPYLQPLYSFPHNYIINSFYGVDQLTLDRTQTKLFISASISQVLAAYKTDGTFIGTIPGVLAEGGVAIC